jgi:hypothetical protein
MEKMQEESTIDLEELKEDDDGGTITTDLLEDSLPSSRISHSNFIIIDGSDEEWKHKATYVNYPCKKRKKILKEKKLKNKVLKFSVSKK